MTIITFILASIVIFIAGYYTGGSVAYYNVNKALNAVNKEVEKFDVNGARPTS